MLPPAPPHHHQTTAHFWPVEYPRAASDLALKASTATFWVSPSFPHRAGAGVVTYNTYEHLAQRPHSESSRNTTYHQS